MGPEAIERAARALAERPRHAALAVVVAGLLVGGCAAAWTLPVSVAAAAVAWAAAWCAGAGPPPAVAVPDEDRSRPSAAVEDVRSWPVAAADGDRSWAVGAARWAALAAVLVSAAAWWGHARTEALDRTALAPLFGEHVAGTATVTAAPRRSALGGWRVLARWRGEPVLLRLAEGRRRRGLEVGAVVMVRGRLRAPDLAAQAVHAHATLRAKVVRPTGRRRGGLAGVVDGIRRRAERALAHGPPPAEGALLRGMVLGQDDALPDDLREAFRAAGLSHLVAASGANVALLAALALALCAVTGIGIRARWVLVLALIALYVPLAGGGPSIQRAGVMGAATVAAALAGRPTVRWHAVLLAAVVTLAADPRSAGDAGWQLSFA
ncbi:MAG: ComEC/Rec2 family competence protein, partial [Solirubrobacterales bacterium]|nr:ComEC/Rec2 family competence protein [Solirubrobacterales bacterium]